MWIRQAKSNPEVIFIVTAKHFAFNAKKGDQLVMDGLNGTILRVNRKSPPPGPRPVPHHDFPRVWVTLFRTTAAPATKPEPGKVPMTVFPSNISLNRARTLPNSDQMVFFACTSPKISGTFIVAVPESALTPKDASSEKVDAITWQGIHATRVWPS